MRALSTRQRVLASLVLVAGAVASVATSQIQWSLTSQPATVPPAVLDAAAPAAAYRVEIDLDGPATEPEGSLSIALTPSVTIVPGAPAPSLRVQVYDWQTGEIVHDQVVAIDPVQPAPIYAYAPAWGSCTSACSEAYEVSIERTDLLPDAPSSSVAITGTVTVDVGEYGKDGEPPAGTAVSVSVARIGAP